MRCAHVIFYTVVSLAVIGIGSFAFAGEPMKCEVGPVDKTIGTGDWFVYGCEDDKSLVFVTKKNNPAFPFFFMYAAVDGKYKLHGEGNGAKQYTKLAFEELKAYKWENFESLLLETSQKSSLAELKNTNTKQRKGTQE